MTNETKTMNKSLIVWIKSYSSYDTMKFDDVTNFSESMNDIAFNYNGRTTREQRHAKFLKGSIAGYALSKVIDDEQ